MHSYEQWYHAWITTRRPYHIAAGSLFLGGPNGKHIAGNDTLHETILVHQDGKIVGFAHHYFGQVHVIKGGRQAYGGKRTEDTVCNFRIDPTRGFRISYCLSNLSQGTRESARTMHEAVLRCEAKTTTGQEHITWDRVLEATRAGLILHNDPNSIAKDEVAFRHVVNGVKAAQNLIFANMDGPVAFNEFWIEDPSRMKLNEPSTEFVALTRSKCLTGASDYEVDFRIKVLAAHEIPCECL